MADEVQMTGRQIAAEIANRTDAEIDKLPHKLHHVWVARSTPAEAQVRFSMLAADPKFAQCTDQQKSFELAKLLAELDPMLLSKYADWPMSAGTLIFEMFEDETEVRVYAIPKMSKDMTEKPPVVLNRYRICKANPLPTYGVEAMVLETWMNEVAREWDEVDGDISAVEIAVEEERDDVVEYLKSLPADYQIKDAIEDVEEKLHLVETEDDDDDEEEEEEKKETKATEGETPSADAANGPVTNETASEAAPQVL